MDWKFWKPKQSTEHGSNVPKSKLPGPKELPQQIGQYLVVQEKSDPDWAWSLKCVLRPLPDKKSRFDCRVFDPSKAGMYNIRIVNYTSLDDHPELILFQGWFDKETSEVKLQKKGKLMESQPSKTMA
jgi:hypothetical protein